jgi:general secretion pathway protein D
LAQVEFDAGTETSLRSRPIVTGQEGEALQLALSGPLLSGAPLGASGTAPGVVAQAAPAPGAPASAASSAVPLPAAPPPGAAPGAGAAAFSWLGPTSARVGAAFTVALSMNAGDGVASVPFALGFDTRTLEVVSVAEGDLLRRDGAATVFNQRVDRGAGQVFGTVARGAGGAGGAARGSGTLVEVTFRALAPGPAGIRVVSAAPVGDGGRVLSVPAPAPFSLVVGP